MHIVLIGVATKLSDSHVKFHECSNCEEAKVSILIIQPEYVLVHEDQARDIVALAQK